MQNQTKQVSPEYERRLERALVSQTLRRDRTGDWLFSELAAELDDAEPLAIHDALANLAQTGVIEITGEDVRASPASRRLDALDMIAL
ncbi:MAG TPA: hypothetical protein VGI24_04090 [Solirubrobacteraceae bacterium]|jgi:hypothetical protein